MPTFAYYHSARRMLYTVNSPILLQVPFKRALLIDTFSWVKSASFHASQF